MHLILWRHADAEDGLIDLQRRLTERGQAQAQAMAAWLQPRLPAETRIISSEARRAIETVEALGRPYEISSVINPEADYANILTASRWPQASQTVLLVGHQPTLGTAINFLLHGVAEPLSVKKGSIWWLSYRQRHGEAQTALQAMLTPAMLEDKPPARGRVVADVHS